MYYCARFDALCESANELGCCRFTCCNKEHQYKIVHSNQLNNSDFIVNTIIFPQTIGDITFYNRQELIKWVEDQQQINKDPNYGIGNWC